MSVWTTARIEPVNNVKTAITQMIGCQSSRNVGNVEKKTRNSPAKPAALAAAAMKQVAGLGAPWHAPGVHVGNGAAATLKPRPTISNAMPASSTPLDVMMFSARKRAISARLVDPVAPEVRATPYRNSADENSPSTKYFMAASPDSARRRWNPAITYNAID